MQALLAARPFGEGYATTEMPRRDAARPGLARASRRASASSPTDVEAFEAAVLERHGLDLPAVPPRYRSAYFNHVFGGGYSAAYYSYLWAEVLDADAADWFREHGGLRRASGDAFRTASPLARLAVDPMTPSARSAGATRGPAAA